MRNLQLNHHEDREQDLHCVWRVSRIHTYALGRFSLLYYYVHSSSGLGLGTIQDLLSFPKTHVAIFDRSPPPKETSDERTKYFEVDITKVGQIEKAVEDAVEWTRKTGAVLGGVINCAGVGTAGKVCAYELGCGTKQRN